MIFCLLRIEEVDKFICLFLLPPRSKLEVWGRCGWPTTMDLELFLLWCETID